MPRLIWVFAGRIDDFVGFVMLWLIIDLISLYLNLENCKEKLQKKKIYIYVK